MIIEDFPYIILFLFSSPNGRCLKDAKELEAYIIGNNFPYEWCRFDFCTYSYTKAGLPPLKDNLTRQKTAKEMWPSHG